MTKTNKIELTLERRSEILDTILRGLVTTHPNLGELLMLLRPGDYASCSAEVLDHKCPEGEYDGGRPFSALAVNTSSEELRALLLPFVAEALEYVLDVNATVTWADRSD